MSAPAFTERDVQKAVSAVIKAGVEIGRIEIDRKTGRIIILPAGHTSNKTTHEDEIAGWLEDNGDG